MAKTTKKPSKVVKKPPMETRENPFEKRSNHRARHPALNRKVKGSNRNVGKARTQAQEKRENEILSKIAKRRTVTEIVDRRFGENEGGDKLTAEEKMLKRFQLVRSKKVKRGERFQLGDDDDDDKFDSFDGGDDDLTHQGRSLSEILDEEAVVESEDDDEDVDALVARLKSGETLNDISSEPKKHLTKREAMLDVIRKSKILKMERQREKEEDEEERDRVDALMHDVVTSGQLSFRPTKVELEKQERDANIPKVPLDDYEKMVRELQMDRGPRAAATERTKTPEEIAAEEMKELERLEAERLKRMDADADEEELDEDEESDKESHRRKHRKRAVSTQSDESAANMAGAEASDLPFVIECPSSHAEFLRFLSAHPNGDLNVIITRIRKATSIHLKAENRQRLVKFSEILTDHLMLLGDRLVQLAKDDSYLNSSAENIGIILAHLFSLAQDIPRDMASIFANKIDACRRSTEMQLAKCAAKSSTGDLGVNQAEFSKSSTTKKLPGGHKEGLAEQLNEELNNLTKLKKESDLANSATRCWPSGGEIALFGCVPFLFSATDQRHPIASACALLLAHVLVESPIRGPKDVCAAIQTAELLELITRRNEGNMHRFAPELFIFLRTVLHQLTLSTSKQSTSQHSPREIGLFQMDPLSAARVQYHEAFDALRDFVKSHKSGSTSKTASLRGVMSYNKSVTDMSKKEKTIFAEMQLERIKGLISKCMTAVSVIPSADALLDDILTSVRLIAPFKELVDPLEKAVAECKSKRKPLKLQDFAPEDKSLAPRFLTDAVSAKRAGDEMHALKRQLKRERKGVARELRLDGQFIAETRAKQKFQELQQARSERQKNFQSLESQQAQFNRLVKEGVAIKGAGVGGLSYKGHKKGKKLLPEE